MDSIKEQDSAIIALSSFILCLGSLKTIEDEQQLKGKKNRNSWVSYINTKRPPFGAYHSTMAQLEVSESQKWRNYMTLKKHLFTAILQSISGRILKQDTRCSVAIPLK